MRQKIQWLVLIVCGVGALLFAMPGLKAISGISQAKAEQSASRVSMENGEEKLDHLNESVKSLRLETGKLAQQSKVLDEKLEETHVVFRQRGDALIQQERGVIGDLEELREDALDVQDEILAEIQRLEERIKELETERDKLQKDAETIGKEVETVRKANETLRTNISNKEKEVGDLKSRVAELTKELTPYLERFKKP